jgi:cyclophilin family peptidyl-prolyl cis-trans isomerase
MIVTVWLALTVALQAGATQTPAPAPSPGNPVAVVTTTLGEVTIELLKGAAPVSVQNFVQYAQEGFYTGTIFHRVIPDFMVQGGGFTPAMEEKPTRPPIRNEATNRVNNVRGTVAMARTRALRSATSQFFINVGDNRSKLDHRGYGIDDFGYAVFGRVLSGMDVVDKIAGVKTHSVAGHEDVPIEPVIIKSVIIKQ